MAGTRLLRGCPSTFSTFIMSCENDEENEKSFGFLCSSLPDCSVSCQKLKRRQAVWKTGDLPLGYCQFLTDFCSAMV